MDQLNYSIGDGTNSLVRRIKDSGSKAGVTVLFGVTVLKGAKANTGGFIVNTANKSQPG